MHNEYRQQLLECKVDGQPAPKRMPQLIWDEELASQAEAQAKSCTFYGNYPKSRRFKSVEQNIASCGSVEDVMKRWFSQHISYNFKENKCLLRCDQYLKMVSANTTHIGCAAYKCPSGEHYYILAIVCNYGPGLRGIVRPYEAKNIDEVCPM
uniref:SCP domain-containing protein n=1 Tax=Trichobilharzia regenti TaxID=157069 RepID=A0AA85J4F8_TRIRE